MSLQDLLFSFMVYLSKRSVKDVYGVDGCLGSEVAGIGLGNGAGPALIH